MCVCATATTIKNDEGQVEDLLVRLMSVSLALEACVCHCSRSLIYNAMLVGATICCKQKNMLVTAAVCCLPKNHAHHCSRLLFNKKACSSLQLFAAYPKSMLITAASQLVFNDFYMHSHALFTLMLPATDRMC
eukprot:scaffold63255_cov19-Tisochrysis_lutea.AAC.1